MKRTVLYARVSSQRQADKDLSIPSQFEQMRKYCQERGWEIIEEIADEAESGRSTRRAGLQKILTLAEQTPPPFEALLVWKLSRFTRSLRDAVNLEYELKQRGIEVISISEPTDDTPIGHSFRDIMHIINQLYSLQLGEDTRRGQAENARRGYWNGGPYPLGYRPQKSVDDKGNIHTQLELDPENTEVIEHIFQMYLSGKGIKVIAIVLNAEGRKTNYGKPFAITTIAKILRNEVYTGTYTWGSPPQTIRIENAYPALISPETFQRAQKIIAQRATLHPRAVNSQFKLSGLLHCGKCGKQMTGSSTRYQDKKYRYYYCGTYRRIGKQFCDMKPMEADKLEGLVVEKIKEKLIAPADIDKILSAVSTQSEQTDSKQQQELENAARKLDDVESRIQTLYEALETGKIPIDIISPRLRELTALKGQLELEIFHLKQMPTSAKPTYTAAEITQHVNRLETLFAGGTLDEQRVFIRSFVRRVVVSEEKVDIDFCLW